MGASRRSIIMACRSSSVSLFIFLVEVATLRYKKGTLHTLKSIIIKDYFLNYLCSALFCFFVRLRSSARFVLINVEYLIKLTRIVSEDPTYTTLPVAIKNKASKRNRGGEPERGFLLIVSYFILKNFPAYSVIYFCLFTVFCSGAKLPWGNQSESRPWHLYISLRYDRRRCTHRISWYIIITMT